MPAEDVGIMFRLPHSLAARLCGWRLLALVAGCLLGGGAQATPLQLDERAAIPAWPAVAVLRDSGHALTLAQVIAQPQRFAAPTGTPSNLGRVADTVWLRIPVHVPGTAQTSRVLEIDYPALNRIDAWVLRDGQTQVHFLMGSALRFSERPMPSRAHAVTLTLLPGDSVLMLRVQTATSMILPITLRNDDDFLVQAQLAQILQGLLAGLALCMLIYSVAHWVGLRDQVFRQYATMVAANALFTLSYFGIAAQYLWPDWPELSMRITPLMAFVTIAAGCGFIRATLAVTEISRATDWALRSVGACSVLALAGGALGWLSYPATQVLASTLGIGLTALAVPVAFARARRGDRIAAYILVGWVFYLCGAVAITGMLRGLFEPGLLMQYLYSLSTMAEMAAWMAVLGLRVQSIHRSAGRDRAEIDAQRALANTDALTGLPNRRGLNDRLNRALRAASPQQLLAVYLLDLDGFKPVNDRYGHDVGDALLVAVGQRLKSQLRAADVVARLGGDEFVVVVGELSDESAAHALGQKILSAFDAPFEAAGQTCRVGLTIGYALAPLDGHGAGDLLKRADAAMYAGKQAGRNRVERGGRNSTHASAEADPLAPATS